MFGKRKYSLLSLALLLALLAAAVMPFAVFAQDGTPPPADPPVVEEVPPAEDLTVPEVLEQLPADTTLVVLDQSGEALPLTAEEAAAVVVTGDPIWCPSGVDPNPGVGGCTDAQSSFSELITVLQTKTDGDNFDYEGAGTIYVAKDYDASLTPDYGTNIDFDQTELGLTDLVVQGGWGGAAGSSSNLSGINSLNFRYWSSPLTLNDLILDGAGWNGPKSTDTGLTVLNGSGNVELNHVTVTHSDEYGVWINNDGDVTIKNSDFSNNGQVDTYSYVNTDGSTYLYQSDGTYGYGDGLYLTPSGNVTLDNVSANGNYGSGAFVYTEGTVDIINSQFNSNGSPDHSSSSGYDWASNWSNSSEGAFGDGLDVSADGNVTLNGVSAIGNAGYGADVDSSGTVDITNSQFNSNGSPYSYSSSGNNIWDGNYWSNEERGYGDGLDARGDVGLTLNGVSASGNLGYGAGVGSYGTVNITDSQFNSNGTPGFYEWVSQYSGSYNESYDTGGAYLDGNVVTLTNVTASDNYLDGVVLRGGKGGVFAMAKFEEGAMPEEGGVMATITCSTFENNGGYGVYSYLPGTLAFIGVTFNGNAEGGYYHEGAVNVGPCQPVAEDGSDKKGQTSEPLYIVVEQLQSQLPTLGNGLTFGSAFKVELTGTGEKVQGLEITLAFPIPDGMKDADLGVMFWNGSAWVEVPGGGVVDGKFVITVTTPGLYVLVSK